MTSRISSTFQDTSQAIIDSQEGKWETRDFGECAVLIRNTVTPSQFEEEPYIGLEHIGEGTLSLIDVGKAQDVNSTKARFQSGDILFGRLFGELNPALRKVIRPRFGGICSTDIWVVRPTRGVDAGFLFHLMASPEFVNIAMRGSEGTTMQRAKWDHVSRIKIHLPPFSEQQKISRILKNLDDKIEFNRTQNGTLEEMARALFKSWLTKFDILAKSELDD